MERRTSKEQFDRQASHYDGQWNRWTEETLAWILDKGQFRESDRVLDAATGAGFTAAALAPLVKSVAALDVSTGMLAEARARAAEAGYDNISFHEGPAEAMPFGDGVFEAVTCRMACHHFESPASFLAECKRVLVPGGRLLIADSTVPDDDSELDEWQNRVELLRDPSHKRNYSPGEWRRMLSEAGFTIEELDSTASVIPLTLEPWLRKGGCVGEREQMVREMFSTASPAVRETFGVRPTDDAADTAFHWVRVVMAARKV